jgi:vacuolar-type H+-ATPase subunit I/STV1
MSALIASFAIVFLRAIQQQNVIHGRYKSAAITSYMIAIAEVGVVLIVVNTGWPAVPWIGTGGALGVTFAMYAHRRWLR